MRNIKWVGWVVSLAFPLLLASGQAARAQAATDQGQPGVAASASLSPGAAEVVRLASSGVGDDVTLAYIKNSQDPFNLTADDVLYLKDIGLSSEVMSAMLSHDTTLRGQPQPYAPASPATVPPAPAVPAGNAPPTYDWQTPAAPAAMAPAAVPPATAAPAPTYVTSPPADVTYFYDSLSPYGTWAYLEGYGWCWQPQTVVIARGWRPYCDGGHWVYTDLGWYWESDYSWGWAPFHYGRWALHPRCGWVWLPDRVWGPAWVTWRVAGDSCGWAPLPPHANFDVRLGWTFNGVRVAANFGFGLGINAFAFVSLGDFCNHNLAHRCLPPARVTTVYRQTTVVNNYVVNKNVIVHRGIPFERITAASRVAVPRATVHEWSAASARRPSHAGAVVYRRPLAAPARPVNIVAQRVDARHPVIQHASPAPGRTERPSASNRSASAQRQPTAHSYKPAPTLPTPAKVPRAPDNWKQGATVRPGYRSDAGLAAYHKAQAAEQAPSKSTQTSATSRNLNVYHPKGYYQAAEIKQLPGTGQRKSEASSPRGRNGDSRSRKQR